MGIRRKGQSMSFYIGCAIWAYKGWVGDFFPSRTSPAQFLRLYAQTFTTVEVNATFYSIPAVTMLQRWGEETPDGFQFCPKLPRNITHEGFLRPKIEAAKAFIALMQNINIGQKHRLGPLLMQLPPSYRPQFFPDLEAFLLAIQDCGVSIALEVRHREWFLPAHEKRLNALLTELALGRVLLDTRPIYEAPDNPQLQSERKKPKVPLHPVTTASFSLIRYISHPDRSFNEPFMRFWHPYLQEWLHQGKDIYLFVHCPIEEHSPKNAAFFHQLLSEEGLLLPPLPRQPNDGAPQQLNLF